MHEDLSEEAMNEFYHLEMAKIFWPDVHWEEPQFRGLLRWAHYYPTDDQMIRWIARKIQTLPKELQYVRKEELFEAILCPDGTALPDLIIELNRP